MRLHLLVPPLLVDVTQPGGGVLPGLLLAERGGRRFVQVHRGDGDNVLRWVGNEDTLPPGSGLRATAIDVDPVVARRRPRALR